MHRPGLLILLLGLGFAHAFAQEEAKPPSPAAGVRITFLPPPIEGTVSLGIYDKAGKLVRTLKREATEQDFVVGLNGFITSWDGKDDAGNATAPGKYVVRGYSVGMLDVEGVAFHCNDWVKDDDSPRIKRILRGGGFIAPGSVSLPAEFVDGRRGRVTLQPDAGIAAEQKISESAENSIVPPDQEPPQGNNSGLPPGATHAVANGTRSLACGEGKVWLQTAGGAWVPLRLEGLSHAVQVCWGSDTIWVIDQLEHGSEVKEYSVSGEVLRLLPADPGEPSPKWIAANGRDRICLLEENDQFQRVRVLSRDAEQEPAGGAAKDQRPISTWKTIASKTIRFSEGFQQVSTKLGRAQPFRPEPRIPVRLLPNPLYKDTATNVVLEIGYDKDGAILRTSDGLPLIHVTDTPNLKWAVMGRENGTKAITIFHSDGAVVEEFRVGKLANMMSFDAGEYEWAGKP